MITVAFSGSRHLTDDSKIWLAIKSLLADYGQFRAVVGDCRGADKLVSNVLSSLDIPFAVLRADWQSFGRSAGPRRNAQLCDAADLLIAFPLDGAANRGTTNCCRIFVNANKPVYYFVCH